MPPEFPHIFLHDSHETANYVPLRGGSRFVTPPRNREGHYRILQHQLQEIKSAAASVWRRGGEREGITRDGVYVEFSSSPGFQLKTEGIENRRAKIRLCNIRTLDEDESQIQTATLFFPRTALTSFSHKLDEYHEKESRSGNPRHADLVNSIERFCSGTLLSIWTDSRELLPKGDRAEWCELWLDTQGHEPTLDAFCVQARSIGVELDDQQLRFPERVVLLARAKQSHLRRLISTCSCIAEFRRAKETARFFLEAENRHQTEWVDDLARRISVRRGTDVSVCILDTGANNGHPLLSPVLDANDCQVVDPSWSKTDVDGHGTGMCGLAAYGDLVVPALASGPINVEHRLESVKILSNNSAHEPPWYGYITTKAVSLAEDNKRDNKRILCMAVTASDDRDQGKPSSWSSAIDAMLADASDEHRRMMVIAAGNVGLNEANGYPLSNTKAPQGVRDPGQSWNAITVGAYTQKDVIQNPSLAGYVPLAHCNELSPASTTSVFWSPEWPCKPDVVLEGGNFVRAPNGTIDIADDLLLLTTGRNPQIHQFDFMNATSAATALAAKMAAEIQVRYPSAWPETIRGLMIHAAEWPDALKRQFLRILGKSSFQKRDYATFLRFCGYGVPSEKRAIDCAQNTLTLIAQEQIQPFEKKGNVVKAKDVHFYKLPWPKEELLSLGATKAILRITLSYFIEPAPGETGRNSRYQYASHLLRFDINKETESEEAFRNRINHSIGDEDGGVSSHGGSSDWLIGPQGRDKGSIHSDWIETTAANLATRNLIAIYPKTGWWKTRPYLEGWRKQGRYSLIVSVTTEEQSVDIYTPTAIQVSTPISVHL